MGGEALASESAASDLVKHMAKLTVLTDVDFQLPSVRNADATILLGDYISFVTGENREAYRYWGIVLEIVVADGEKNFRVVMLKPSSCNQIIRYGSMVRVKEAEVWGSHAPGSFPKYQSHLFDGNTAAHAARANGKESIAPCTLPFLPCEFCEPRLNVDFEDARGCWNCGEAIEDDGFACDVCGIARYCDKECAQVDAEGHRKPCMFWQFEKACKK